MRNTLGAVARIIVMLVLAFAAAQAAPPASSSNPAGQNAATSQPGQMASENPSPQTEAEIAQKVTHVILTDPYYGVFDSLGYRIEGRTVILTGQVTSANSILKSDMEKGVKKIEGVEKVVNNIEVLPPSPTDERIRRAVYNAIYNYGPFMKYKNARVNPPIRIIVKNSRVTLTGIVDTETDKNVCTLRVNQVPSVLSVTNNLQVARPKG
jgi:hyperosmotically inducible periplasmic protein